MFTQHDDAPLGAVDVLEESPAAPAPASDAAPIGSALQRGLQAVTGEQTAPDAPRAIDVKRLTAEPPSAARGPLSGSAEVRAPQPDVPATKSDLQASTRERSQQLGSQGLVPADYPATTQSIDPPGPIDPPSNEFVVDPPITNDHAIAQMPTAEPQLHLSRATDRGYTAKEPANITFGRGEPASPVQPRQPEAPPPIHLDVIRETRETHAAPSPTSLVSQVSDADAPTTPAQPSYVVDRLRTRARAVTGTKGIAIRIGKIELEVHQSAPQPARPKQDSKPNDHPRPPAARQNNLSGYYLKGC